MNRTIKPITPAGRKRVMAALDKHGMLLVQGQWELPSIADLLEGAPIITRGYSYDYVPAWMLREELIALPLYALCKLFRGKSTVVHRRLWPAVNALASTAATAVRMGKGGQEPRKLLALIEEHPGITGAELKRSLAYLGKEGSRKFLKVKGDLEQWLCIWGEEQAESEEQGHTHDQLWHPWKAGKIGADGTAPGADAALRELSEHLDGVATATAFPVAKLFTA